MKERDQKVRSFYRERLFRCQQVLGKSKNDLSSFVTEIIAYGIIFIVFGIGLFFLFRWLIQEGPEEVVEVITFFTNTLVGPIALILILILVFLKFLTAIVRLFKSLILLLFGRSRTVSCPNCLKEYKLFKKFTQFVCSNCQTPFYLHGDNELILLACPSCFMKCAISKNYGTLECRNCNASTIVKDDAWQIEGEMRECPSCENLISSKVDYCANCSHILIAKLSEEFQGESIAQIFLNEMQSWDLLPSGSQQIVEKLLSKNQQGTFINAKLRIQYTNGELNTIEWKTLNQYISLRPLDIVCLQLLDCLTEHSLVDKVVPVLHDADNTHAKFLDALINLLGKDAVLKVSTIEEIENSYLLRREQLIEKIKSINEALGSQFGNVNLKLEYDTIGSDLKKGQIKNPEVLTGAVRTLTSLNKIKTPVVSEKSNNGFKDVKNIALEYSSQIKDRQMFFTPNISPKRLQNAMTYAGVEKDEEILVLIDNTAFGSAKEGVLLSNKAIYSYKKGKLPKKFELSRIQTVTFMPVYIDGIDEVIELHINDSMFFESGIIEKPAMQLFSEMLRKVIGKS